MSSLSTTQLQERTLIPGTLEWQIQERARRVQRIQREREKQRLQSLFLRELRAQHASTKPVGNNNTKLSSTTIPRKSASVKLRKTSPSLSSSSPKKSESNTGVVSGSVIAVKSKAITFKVKKTGKKLARKRSKASTTGTSMKSKSKGMISAPSRKASKTGSKGKSIKSKSKSATSQLQLTIPRSSSTKVKFSKSGTVSTKKSNSFYCPAMTPISILKNRKKIETLCKSSIKPSPKSEEDLRMVNQKKELSTSALDRVPDPGTRISFKPIEFINPPAPQPNIPICKAFPGTKEWEEYWKKFTTAMDKYNKEMNEYERRAAEIFRDDLARYNAENQKIMREKEIYKNLGAKGIEFGLIPPPPLLSKELKGLQIFNGYIMKSKGMKGIVGNVPGSPTGVRFEVDVKGAEPEKVLIQKDHNLLTITMENGRFLRIGAPAGKLAGDIQVWPPVDGTIIIDAP